jgi:hypothetical protein
MLTAWSEIAEDPRPDDRRRQGTDMVVAERVVTSAHAVDYRIERLPILEHPEAHLAEVLDRLNEMGKQGWRVVSLDLTHHPSYSVAAQPSVPLPVLLEKPVGARPVEYRIERMPFQEHPERHLSELLERLTELGKQGWNVACVDLTHHPSYSVAAQPSTPLPVLLERET